MRYSFPRLLEFLIGGRGLVLATMVEAAGSTPQVPGASAVFSTHGLIAGTVGGGLVEGRVQALALECLGDGRTRLAEFRLDADPADQEGAICGGTASVLLDPAVAEARPVFERALEGFRKRRPGLILTLIHPLKDGLAHAGREWLPETAFADPARPHAAKIAPHELLAVLDSRKPRLFPLGDHSVFAEPVWPLPRLIIAGAGHVGAAVAHLASRLDFEVTIIDDRPEFANKDNVPDADDVVVGDIGESVRFVPNSPDNYFVIVTRGHRHDADALRSAVGRGAAYVGMIGSRNKVALMRREFLEKGWTSEEEWDRVRAPIGLDIRSKTVEEIAVSIAAELVLARAARADKDRP
jgi:xanthine dehydrogenase accessory factor